LPKNIVGLWKKLKGEFDHLNIFNEQFFEVPILRCHIAFIDVKCQDWDANYSQELKHLFALFFALYFYKRVCFLIPILWYEDTNDPIYNEKALDSQPFEANIKNHHFWIIGGQHTVMEYKYF
jgi:hypothetical protein